MSSPAKFPHKKILVQAALNALADGKEHSIRDIRNRVAADLGITQATLELQYQYHGRDSGSTFERRMNNVLMETKNEGAIVNTRRGYYQLPLENQNPPCTEPGVNARIPNRPMGRKEYRKWLISELARLELLS